MLKSDSLLMTNTGTALILIILSLSENCGGKLNMKIQKEKEN